MRYFRVFRKGDAAAIPGVIYTGEFNGDIWGVLKTEDRELIDRLVSAGTAELTEAQYESALKKKPQSLMSSELFEPIQSLPARVVRPAPVDIIDPPTPKPKAPEPAKALKQEEIARAVPVRRRQSQQA